MEMNRIYNEDCLTGLKKLADNTVDCCVTSPPYWGLRDYGVEGQLGMEETPEAYVQKVVEIFGEVRRILKPDGTLWLNLGDSYATGSRNRTVDQACANSTLSGSLKSQCQSLVQQNKIVGDLKPKDLVGIPWMVAFALRAQGYYLRQDIIWAKKNCMPESVKDRCTRSHEYIFMFSKSQKYFYDAEAIKEPAIYDVDGTGTAARKARQHNGNKLLPTEKTNGIRAAGFKEASKFEGKHKGYDLDTTDKLRANGKRQPGFEKWDQMTKEEQGTGMRNKRDVWSISPAQFPEAHFATFPEEIPATCIKAGCPENGLVLDPFMGAGTTAMVARKLNRNFIGFELNPEYIAIAERRLEKELGMFQ